MRRIQDIHVRATEPLIAPHLLKNEMPVEEGIARTVVEARETIREILAGRDRRMLCIVGPCSIHDPDAAMDYARRLAKLKDATADRLYVIMRVYFEKPRIVERRVGVVDRAWADDTKHPAVPPGQDIANGFARLDHSPRNSFVHRHLILEHMRRDQGLGGENVNVLNSTHR